MTDRTNECPSHSLVHGCTMNLKERFENHLFDHKEYDIQADGKHKDMWDSIKEKVNLSFLQWALFVVGAAMMVLFGINKEAISEIKQDNACTDKTISRIEKKVDRIAIELKLKNWDSIDWGE